MLTGRKRIGVNCRIMRNSARKGFLRPNNQYAMNVPMRQKRFGTFSSCVTEILILRDGNKAAARLALIYALNGTRTE